MPTNINATASPLMMSLPPTRFDKCSACLRAENHTDGQNRGPADAVRKHAVSDVDQRARERHHGKNEM